MGHPSSGGLLDARSRTHARGYTEMIRAMDRELEQGVAEELARGLLVVAAIREAAVRAAKDGAAKVDGDKLFLCADDVLAAGLVLVHEFARFTEKRRLPR